MRLGPQQLVALVTQPGSSMPVRDMENLIAWGKEATPWLIDFLHGRRDQAQDDEVELLWPVVVLGELRDPDSLMVLWDIIQYAPGLELAVAAAEASAKMGEAAIDFLEEEFDDDLEIRSRLLVYCALGRTAHPRAWRILEDRLQADEALDFAVARALAERNTREDIERIYLVYAGTSSWKRSVLEETLIGMLSGELPWEGTSQNWRLRYRRQPRQGMQVPLSWPAVLFLIWEAREDLRPGGASAILTLDQLRQSALIRRQRFYCEDCGQPLRCPTGVPLCGEVEADLIAFQIDRIQQWRADQWQDIFEIMDELDHQEVAVLQWPETTDAERADKGEALHAIDLVKGALAWMLDHGIDDLEKGEKRLAAALKRAGSPGS
jgi:hypothetical protein